jgi:hypothetical protein
MFAELSLRAIPVVQDYFPPNMYSFINYSLCLYYFIYNLSVSFLFSFKELLKYNLLTKAFSQAGGDENVPVSINSSYHLKHVSYKHFIYTEKIYICSCSFSIQLIFTEHLLCPKNGFWSWEQKKKARCAVYLYFQLLRRLRQEDDLSPEVQG